MKDRLPAHLEKYRVDHPMYVKVPPGSIEGAFVIPSGNAALKVICGVGDGWDHVSVSLNHRAPHWKEMCFIKRLFFKKDELVLQFHPPEAEYINFHQNVLHMWRPWNQTITLPPAYMIA